MVFKISRVIANILFTLFRRVRYIGKENLPAGGSMLVIANHTSMYDPVVVGLALQRPSAVMAKKELFSKPLVAKYLTAMGAFPVDRGETDRAALKTALRILQNGQTLVLFPEGTRGNGKELLPFKNGAAYLAMNTDCLIVPMAIENSSALFKYFRRPVTVCIGTPFRFDAAEGESRRAAMDRLLQEQEDAVRRLWVQIKNE